MKNQSLLIVTFFCAILHVSAQEAPIRKEKYTTHNKGKFYIYWGGNRETYSKSDIHFKGNDYDFTLYNVSAHDKSKGFHIDYFNPTRMTIPQTNFRVGYFITDKYNISLGFDHMKYVMYQDRAVNYSGYYPNEGSYGESLPNGQVLLTKDFLKFEHTDGLNYVNTEISRVDDISKWFGIMNTDILQVNLTEGVGGGFLYPRTNTTLLGKDRYDEFHISGYGLSAKAGLNITFLKYFFIQGELKGGYIDMNNIRTTKDKADSAEQNFWFFQRILVVGGVFKI
ncbi:hypothetical protein [Flavobacterium sp.]|uniref:hypothetical protein n=1 Tax=Flavobacterium sp. TaxID=239 RepID=UPI0035271E13